MSDERPGPDHGEPSVPGGPLAEASAVLPPRPDLSAHPGPSTPPRRRRWPWIAAALLLVNAVVAFVVLRRGDPELPDRIAGLPRLETDQARSFEDLLSGFTEGGISLRGAMYGSGDQPELILERFVGTDDPFQGIPIETVLGQAGSAFGEGLGSGGEIDVETALSQTREGVDYACAPYRGSAPGAGQASIICVFSGDVSGLVVDLRTTYVTNGMDDAQAAYRAVVGSS